MSTHDVLDKIDFRWGVTEVAGEHDPLVGLWRASSPRPDLATLKVTGTWIRRDPTVSWVVDR